MEVKALAAFKTDSLPDLAAYLGVKEVGHRVERDTDHWGAGAPLARCKLCNQWNDVAAIDRQECLVARAPAV
jgi:hypothetical protein